MDRRTVLLVGLATAALGGTIAANAVGVPAGLTLAALFGWTFLLAFGANLALTAILRGPPAPWKALMPAVFCFGPFFLGPFPTGNWMSMSRFAEGRLPLGLHGFDFFLFLWGLIAPGGFIVDGIRRARAGLSGRA